MRYWRALLLVACAPISYSQNSLTSHSHSSFPIPLPRPYVLASLDFPGGGGYAPYAPVGGVGIQINSKHFILDANVWYEAARKVNDGTQPNPKGHERGIAGDAYYRFLSQWFIGGGAGWSETSTTNYSKEHWHPSFGGGRDFFTKDCLVEGCAHDFSMRLSVDYILAGSDWQNGGHGPSFAFYMPSPTAKRHVFVRETFRLYRFHDTLTDRSNVLMTQQQLDSRHFWGDLDLSIIYRF